VRASVADVPTMGVAGTDRDNSQRRGVGDPACAHQYRDREAAPDDCFEGVDGSQFSTLYLGCGTARMACSISAWSLGLLSMAMWEIPKSPPRLMFESLP
jgi:hypothetical protein